MHVQSQDPIPDVALPFPSADHVANIVFTGDLNDCARRVAEHRPVCVIPGCELGVVLADALSELLGLPTNGSALTTARRDKLVMQRTIAAAGLRSIPSHASSEWSSIQAWIKNLKRFPVIIKPSASAATDQVFVCTDLAQAEDAFKAIIGSAGMLGYRNDNVLAQQYVQGVEYMMNTVSVAGHHLMTDWWRINKVVSEHPVYEYGQLQSPTGELQRLIFEYTCAVLDVLGIRYGAVHTELMLTDEGPVLIEVNCRVDGQRTPVLVAAALGDSQIDVSLDAYLNPERFFARMAAPSSSLRRHASRVELICPKTGKLIGLPMLEQVRTLRAFFQLDMHVHPGEDIPRTIDLKTCPGYVDLIHDDPSVIQEDYLRIREWEAASFYQFAE